MGQVLPDRLDGARGDRQPTVRIPILTEPLELLETFLGFIQPRNHRAGRAPADPRHGWAEHRCKRSGELFLGEFTAVETS